MSDRLGVFSRPELLERGYSDAQLRTAVAQARLRRVADGWYAVADAPRTMVRALAAGHRLTCIDAAALHGLWTPYRTGPAASLVHMYRPRGDRPCPTWARRHLLHSGSWTETDAVASLPLALQHAMRCLDGESAAILLESSIERGLLDRCQVEQLQDGAPGRVRSRIGILSAASDSGSETRVVRALRRRGYTVEQQVYVEGAGFIDAYAGGVFIEIDGREHHSSPAAFDEDRRRDLAVRRQGLQLVRLSYHQTWRTWDATLRAVLETIEQVGAQGKRRVEQLAAA